MAELGFDITSAKSSARANKSPLAERPPRRASTYSDTLNPSRTRLNSTFSDSIDEAKQSLFSSTDDLLQPTARSSKVGDQGEQSFWHSAPLALALLPAVGGLIFQNGGHVVTDITLLILAAVFLNWSVRLPWDWYHASQSTRSPYPLPPRDSVSSNNIMEEGSKEEAQPAISQEDSNGSKPKTSSNEQSQPQYDARFALRIHEMLALFSCFLFPIAGAWLLHMIRTQLSRPSEGLVSNYNLTIFVLAAEIRPIAHLFKMIQARTLFLQRSLIALDEDVTPINTSSLLSIISRLDDLEAHISAASTDPNRNMFLSDAVLQKINNEVRKSLQPDLDALNRAIRRSEKRTTLLNMQTEARLQDLEARMSDAITLAAAAERTITTQNSQRRSSTLTLLDWICAAVVLPIQSAWAILSLPARAAVTVLGSLEGFVGRKVRREMKTAGKATSNQERKGPASTRAQAQGRGMKRAT